MHGELLVLGMKVAASTLWEILTADTAGPQVWPGRTALDGAPTHTGRHRTRRFLPARRVVVHPAWLESFEQAGLRHITAREFVEAGADRPQKASLWFSPLTWLDPGVDLDPTPGRSAWSGTVRSVRSRPRRPSSGRGYRSPVRADLQRRAMRSMTSRPTGRALRGRPGAPRGVENPPSVPTDPSYAR